MGNDDSLVFDGVGHVKIVDVACPQQMLALMTWIMEGNRGLVYARVMRTESAVLYDSDYTFEFGRGHVLREAPGDAAVIISSGRGVHEALAAATLCAVTGLSVAVVDMPSIDEQLLLRLHQSGKALFFAEQNNGYIWQNFLKVLFRAGRSPVDLTRMFAINTLGADGRPRFIHSGTYDELLAAFGLAPAQIADTIGARVGRAESALRR
jgi:transketolase